MAPMVVEKKIAVMVFILNKMAVASHGSILCKMAFKVAISSKISVMVVILNKMATKADIVSKVYAKVVILSKLRLYM